MFRWVKNIFKSRYDFNHIGIPLSIESCKKLDAILFYLKENNGNSGGKSVRMILFEKGFGCTTQEEKELVNKLIGDGLITKR